ncbi:protein TolR [Thiosulfatimonas sediminis]|uniref:Tol-Pal system protein TolR n=1 Tax=Thiosulfatimonas sediminis TaxID=2675054 RepID=A0A6F8PUR6_9GAMM|nr:ExbD/TolR family protein [Thiosulfatimonas sediminis]BBP45720.1 protein TolR [Thiosulfatimonas sediminis]
MFNQGFRANRRKRRLMAEINVVPYIDVTLVLLIIFMVTAPIVQQAVSVELPQTPQINNKTVEQIEAAPPFVITITADGLYKTSAQPEVIISDREVQTLVAQVVAQAQINQTQQFYIQGDRAAPYGKVIQIFTLLQSNGVANVSLITQPEVQEP